VDSLVEVGNSAVKVSFVLVSVAPVFVREDVIGVDADSLGVVGYGPVVVFFITVGVAPVFVRLGIVGIAVQSLGILRYPLVRVVCPVSGRN
jgi:hypothetical protein